MNRRGFFAAAASLAFARRPYVAAPALADEAITEAQMAALLTAGIVFSRDTCSEDDIRRTLALSALDSAR